MSLPSARTDQVIFEEISGECVVYDAVQKKAHSLNPTLTWIWRRCDGETTIDEMAAAFERQFATSDGLEMVVSGLNQLRSCRLLEGPGDTSELVESPTPTVTRRRSIAAAGSVLVPAMISVLAPVAAAAKSKPDKDKDKHKHNNDD